MRPIQSCLLLTFLTITFAPSAARAHALGVEAKLKDGKVAIEAYYDDDSPAIKAKVQVLQGKDNVVATGITDDKGRWTFDAPPAGKYQVIVDAGAGHKAETTLTIPAAALTDVATSPAAPSISAGPSREEFTRIPWLKIGLGLAAIAILAGAYLLSSLLRKPEEPRT